MNRLDVRPFLSFGFIGALGFVVDATVLAACLRFLGSGLYVSRVYSFLAAATFTWKMNSLITFRSTASGAITEWLQFLLANAVGGFVNLGVYWLLVAASRTAAQHPTLAVAAGSLFGLIWNFALSSRWVFRERQGG